MNLISTNDQHWLLQTNHEQIKYNQNEAPIVLKGISNENVSGKTVLLNLTVGSVGY